MKRKRKMKQRPRIWMGKFQAKGNVTAINLPNNSEYKMVVDLKTSEGLLFFSAQR
jgi:hypothetical protein